MGYGPGSTQSVQDGMRCLFDGLDVGSRAMKAYTFRILARLIGALGARDYYTVTVEAESFYAAVVRLYETHEHIRIVSHSAAD